MKLVASATIHLFNLAKNPSSCERNLSPKTLLPKGIQFTFKIGSNFICVFEPLGGEILDVILKRENLVLQFYSLCDCTL